MLLQGMNSVVDYGYDNNRQFFVDPEAQRGNDGGDHPIVYPLAYLDPLYRQGWLDTHRTWGPPATRRQ